MNVTNFKVKFNHFVISKAFHSSSGISLVGKKEKAIIYVFQCFEINSLDSYHAPFILTRRRNRSWSNAYESFLYARVDICMLSSIPLEEFQNSPTPNHIKYCTTLDTNSETYLCTILLCAFFIIIFVYTFGAIFGILKFSLRVVNAPCSVPTQYPHFLIYNQSKYEHIKRVYEIKVKSIIYTNKVFNIIMDIYSDCIQSGCVLMVLRSLTMVHGYRQNGCHCGIQISQQFYNMFRQEQQQQTSDCFKPLNVSKTKIITATR